MHDPNPLDPTVSSANANADRTSREIRVPDRIGRYQVQGLLGKGGFGIVYRAYDEKLERTVAIKVPHDDFIEQADDLSTYLDEARILAQLDHPNIVPVHDIGSSDDFPCYVVSAYVEGESLAERMSETRAGYTESAELIATLADAVHHAHKKGLVHRDIKPSNILVGADGGVYLVDFGLALREERIGTGSRRAGTPPYMSPEQARGEGHRVDGRSDIFTLGVVLYELLIGRRPFRGESEADLLDSIVAAEPKPLRQYDEKIPKELERICNKAMAKRVRDRFSSAYDMAEELRQFLADQPDTSTTSDGQYSGTIASTKDAMPSATKIDESKTTAAEASVDSTGSVPPKSTSVSTSAWDRAGVNIVPKGLRSFDAHDAEFFLELLPGPRDRRGLPDTLRFWKSRLEELDADETFPVGMIYGPSGCGKSSLVKAGLLPQLTPNISTVYVEATPLETEMRLLHGIRKKFPAVGDRKDLTEAIAMLRLGRGIPPGHKVVLILDHFEQWLHAGEINGHAPLIQALRQCDGGHVQCLVMVRDDFWMAATRFMQELEVPLLEGLNSAAVDLFPIQHARKVLAAFGRAFGTLPDNPRETTNDQRAFLDQATRGLSTDSLVVCVRLALFAEMMKNKAWSTATLKEVGGTKGVGTTFLEETFSASTSPPQYRYHQRAARAVLSALLPDVGSQIKGKMRPRRELQEVSGYEDRAGEFDDLLNILDRETRLITPTDPEGSDVDDAATTLGSQPRDSDPNDDVRYYQLTHDYLVPSLRSWLTRKQQESRRGRANLLLADRAALWSRTQQRRHLPSFVEWFKVKALTDKAKWTSSEKEMMSRSAHVHGVRAGVLLLLLALTVITVQWFRNQHEHEQRVTRADGLINALAKADTTQVTDLIGQLQPLRDVADAKLSERINLTANGAEKLNLSLALLPTDPSQANYLIGQLPSVTPEQFGIVCAALFSDQQGVESLWDIAENEEHRPDERFQALVALANLPKRDARWDDAADFIVNYLTESVPTLYFPLWVDYLRPAAEGLIEPLRKTLGNPEKFTDSQRVRAAAVLSQYLSAQPERLVETLLMTDDYSQYSPLLEALRPHADVTRKELIAALESVPAEELPNSTKTRHRHALASVALVEFDSTDNVWPLLRLTSNPSLRSTIVKYFRRFRVDPQTIADRLREETDTTIRRALVQTLGGTHQPSLTTTTRLAIVEQLSELLLSSPDPGVHASTMWALQQWGAPIPPRPEDLAEITSERQLDIDRWDLEIENIRRQMNEQLSESSEFRNTWEQQLREQRQGSTISGEVARFTFDQPENATASLVSDDIGRYVGSGELSLVPGVLGDAVQLGDDGSIDCGTVLSPEYTDAFSYGCWISFDQIWGAVLSKMDADDENRGFDLWLQQGKLAAHLVHAEPENCIKVIAVPSLIAGNWHHCFVTYDGSGQPAGVSLFVDGERVKTTIREDSTTLADTMRTDKPFLIGGRSHEESSEGAYPYIGKLDDVRVFDRRLSGAEVNSMYVAAIASIARIEPQQRSEQQAALLDQAYRRQVSDRMESKLAAAKRARFEARWNGLSRWYVNRCGQTMMIIADAAHPGAEKFDDTFAISAHEITIEDYERFRVEADVDRVSGPTSKCPMQGVNWWDVAAYCNWLSDQDDIPDDQWCYVPNGEGLRGQGMELKPNYRELSGYRLPSEREWVYACRASTNTPYSAGDSYELMDEYAWSAANAAGRSYEVGSLVPNDFGLFDMHGSVWEWCNDKVTLRGTSAQGRRLVGGSFTSPGPQVTQAAISSAPHSYRSNQYGFRVVRKLD